MLPEDGTAKYKEDIEAYLAKHPGARKSVPTTRLYARTKDIQVADAPISDTYIRSDRGEMREGNTRAAPLATRSGLF